MNPWLFLLFMVLFVVSVTFGYMTPIDRRTMGEILRDTWQRVYDEAVDAVERVKRWWAERQAKKRA